MIVKRGRMLIVKCDNCKTESEHISKLFLVLEVGGKDNVIWDICKECVPKVQSLLEVFGPGRKIRS